MRYSRRSHSTDGSSKRSAASFIRPADDDARNRFINTALGYVDYKPRPGGLTDFGRRTGYNGHEIPWSGSFVDCVARDAQILIPACVYTPTGLAEFIFQKRWRAEPKIGDIAFFSFSTKPNDPFSMPHVGIVVDTTGWKNGGEFVTVEAQIDNTVKTVLRWKYETSGFGRPDFKKRPALGTVGKTEPVSIIFEKIRPASRGRDVLNVQIALSQVTDLQNHQPAIFDTTTQRAFARWQRMIGFVGADATGVPNRQSLERLSQVTGLFSERRETES